ncbi:MAG: efflux RND transporter periplasmic adaptor subunit [Planctomycetota bacterium]|nr:efflux RND transporter periplasmic adaptor subunit [Planctomycetota bacterium]
MTLSPRAKAVLAALSSLPVLIVAGCDKKAGAAAAAAPPAFPPPVVSVAAAKVQDVPVYIDGIGKAMALESVVIMPRVAGQVVKRHVEDGAVVKKDDLLFSLDPLPFEAALESSKALLAQANAGLEYAKLELDRYTSIAGTRAVSKSDIDSKKNSVAITEALLAAAKAQVRTAELNLGYCSIRSPIAGRTGSRMVDEGNMVKVNETALLSVQRTDPIYTEFTVNEQQLAAVRENMAKGTLKAYVGLPSDHDGGREGALTFLDNIVQDATGTVRLRATMPNADQHFWPGQFVKVRLVLRTQKDAVLVPVPAGQLGQQGPYVLVVKEDSTAEMRPIVPGQTQGDWVVIEKGLGAGEKVIVDGQMMVRPGGPVKVQEPATGPAPSADPREQGAAAPAKAEAGTASPAASSTTAPATAPAANNGGAK